eukprot:gene12089-13335_t
MKAEKGFVIVKDLFKPEELQPAIDGVNELVDKLASKLYNAGKIKDKYEKASFNERLILLEKEWKGSPVLLHKEGFKHVWSHEKLLNIVEQIIGPDISGHPVWNLRTKTPGNVETTVPWHQDNAYLEEGSDNILIPTAWIPLIDANLTNGCMMVVSEGHRKGFTAKHACCAGPTWYVEIQEDEIKEKLGVDAKENAIVCEVPFGSVLFINNVVPHKSLLNNSNNIRWSLDLRWNRTQDYNYFYGVKNSIPMRKSGNSNFPIKWQELQGTAAQYATEAAYAREAGKLDELDTVEDDEFDTTVAGPWMTRWEIVHHNKHTKTFQRSANTLMVKP